jgi:hypothetical protein
MANSRAPVRGNCLTPKEMLKGYFEGEGISRPLLSPLIFSYVAKLQRVDLKLFYTNPTILVNTLYNAWKFFQYDVLINYLDETLELEALGCNVEWCGECYKVVAKPSKLEDLNWRGVKERGRIPSAIEAVKRLKIMVREEGIVAGALKGPFALLNHLTEKEAKTDFLQRIANTELEICRAYCEAGADLILLFEKKLPASKEMLHEYVKALLPMRNVANFFETRLILLLKETAPPQSINALQESVDGVILSSQQSSLDQVEIPLGLALPNDLFCDVGRVMYFIKHKLKDEVKPFLLTTEEEVRDIPLQPLKSSISSLKSFRF